MPQSVPQSVPGLNRCHNRCQVYKLRIRLSIVKFVDLALFRYLLFYLTLFDGRYHLDRYPSGVAISGRPARSVLAAGCRLGDE